MYRVLTGCFQLHCYQLRFLLSLIFKTLTSDYSSIISCTGTNISYDWLWNTISNLYSFNIKIPSLPFLPSFFLLFLCISTRKSICQQPLLLLNYPDEYLPLHTVAHVFQDLIMCMMVENIMILMSNSSNGWKEDLFLYFQHAKKLKIKSCRHSNLFCPWAEEPFSQGLDSIREIIWFIDIEI